MEAPFDRTASTAYRTASRAIAATQSVHHLDGKTSDSHTISRLHDDPASHTDSSHLDGKTSGVHRLVASRASASQNPADLDAEVLGDDHYQDAHAASRCVVTHATFCRQIVSCVHCDFDCDSICVTCHILSTNCVMCTL